MVLDDPVTTSPGQSQTAAKPGSSPGVAADFRRAPAGGWGRGVDRCKTTAELHKSRTVYLTSANLPNAAAALLI